MADFIAQIKAQVNTKSFQSELRKLANETPVDVKTKLVLSDIDTNGIESKVQSALDRHKFTISISNIKFAGSTAHLGDTVNSALAKQVQYKIDTRQIDASISDITKKFNKLNSGKFTFNTGDAESRLESIGADLAEIQAIRDRMDFEDDKELVKSYAEISKAIKTAKNELKELADGSEKLANADDISAFGSKLSLWKDNNSKALKQFGGSIELLETRFRTLASSGKMTSSQLQEFEKAFRNIDMAAKAAGVSGKSFGQVFKESLGKLTGYFTTYEVIMRVSQATKQAVQTVVELDDALVDLQKTTTASAEQLNKYYYDANDIAKQYGSTTKDIIQSTADWSRLGFNLQDSQTMAKVASQFKSISPGMDIETATSGLVSIMRAFDISAEDALDGIASKINKIGNTAATSNTEIVTGLEKSSAAMAAMGTSFDETVALFTAGQEIIQDSSRMGNALRTVGMRLRGYNEETEELDDGLKNIAGDLYDLTVVAGKGGVSIFTDETQQHYKSVYQYLGEIADRWEELSEVQRQGFLNKAFAKTRASEGAAIISNFEAARKAIDDMAHSANSANDEMDVITGSLTYKLNALKETGVGIAQNLFARKDVGIIIDGATKILEVIDALTDKLGLFGSLAAGVMIGDLVKNFSKLSGVVTAVKTLGGAFNTLKLTSSIASTSGLGTAFTELASAIGVSTTALGVFASATGVLVGVLGALALDKLIVNASEANDIMSESADKFKSAKDNVVSLREKLRNNNQAIRELNDGTPLTFVEQDELAKLKETNGELRESIKLANEQQEESRKQLAEDSLSAYRKNFKELVDEQKVASRLEAPDLFLDSSSMTNLTDTIAMLRRIEELRESSGDEFAYADAYKEGKEFLREQLNLLSEYKKNLEDAKEYGTITSEQEDALKEIGAQMDFIYKELGDITWQAQKLDAFFGVDSMNALKNELVDLSKSGKLTIDAFSVDKYKPIRDFLDSIGMDWQSFIDDINAGAIDVDSMQRQIKEAFATDETSKQWNDFLAGLTDEDIEIIYELMKSGGADSFSIQDFKDYLDNLNKQSVNIPVKFDFEAEAKKVANVSTALANSLSNTGISIIDSEDTKSDLTNIRQTYGELKGYDESKLFENTANGIHLNREELRKLNIEYEKQNKSVLSKELLSATMEYEKQNRALMKIANTQSVEYEKQLEIVEGAKAEVDAINLKISAYNGLTSVYKKYQDSLSLADERAGYEAINSGYDSVKKLIAQGWAGDEEVRQYVDLLTSGSQQDWSAQELAKRFKELSKNKVAGKFKVTDFFTVDDDGNSTSKGIKNFFDAIIAKQKEVGENWVQLTGEKYEFNFDNQKVADALGVDIELVEQLVKAGSEAGLSLNMNDAVEVMANLSEKIRESDAELEKLGKNPVKVKFDTNDYDSEIEKLQGKLSKLDKGSKTYENVSLKLQKLVELKLEAEQPAYMKLDVSAFEGSAKTALTALQEYGRAVENLNRQKILSPKADTTELRKAVHEAAKNIKKLSDEEKLSIGIDPSWDLKTIKEKLQTGEITIPLTADTEQVKESVRTMISELQNYEISFKTVEDGSIKMFIKDIESSNPEISVGVSGMDEVNEYRKLIDEIPDGKNVKVVASTKGDKEVNTLTKDVNKVPNRKIEVKAETKGTKYVSNLHKAVANLNSKTITVTTNVRGAGEIASLKRLWSDIRNKNVTLTTTTTKVTRYKNIGTVQAYGSARNGNAYVRGKWGIPRKSHALVGELG